jgi:hypothetical protein
MRLKVLTVAGVATVVAALLIPSLVLAGLSGGGKTNKLKARMTGDQVVPAGTGAPQGEGRARITLRPKKGKVCFRVAYSKIGSTKGLNAGIYAGKPGSNGDLAATLFTGQKDSPVKGCAPISKANSKDIRRHPHRFNVDVKTKKYNNGGAIRGQLKPRS